MVLDAELSKYVDVSQGVAQGCIVSPNLFKVYINAMIVAAESARQGVTVGKDTASGLMFEMISWEYKKHPKNCRNK